MDIGGNHKLTKNTVDVSRRLVTAHLLPDATEQDRIEALRALYAECTLEELINVVAFFMTGFISMMGEHWLVKGGMPVEQVWQTWSLSIETWVTDQDD